MAQKCPAIPPGWSREAWVARLRYLAVDQVRAADRERYSAWADALDPQRKIAADVLVWYPARRHRSRVRELPEGRRTHGEDF